MSNFTIMARGLDFSDVRNELAAHPELWGRDNERIEIPDGPFVGTDDIWVRGLPRALLKQDRMLVGQPHFAEFYPAWDMLPSIHKHVFGLIEAFKPVALGTILITRVPQCGEVAEHSDRGWHAEFMNFKAHLAIKSNAGCANYAEGEAFTPETGDVFTFDNLKPHSVQNNGPDERITMIVCMRIEGQ